MSYSFPILTNQEILSCLAEMEVHASEEDLVKPTYESIKQIYEPIVQVLLSVTREELLQPSLSAIDALEFPELHEDSVAVLGFTRALADLAVRAGVHDWSLKDLYKPESKSVKRTLSAMINFAKFREEKVQGYEELREESCNQIQKHQALLARNQQLETELKQMREAREAEIPEVERLKAEEAELMTQVKEKNQLMLTLQNEVAGLKKECSEVADKAAGAKFSLGTAQQEEAQWRSQLVQSPERIRHSLHDLQEQMETDRSDMASAEAQTRALQARLDLLSKTDKEMAKCITLLDQAQQEVNKHKEVSHTLKSSKADLQGNEEEMWRVEQETQHFRRQEEVLKERIQRLTQQGSLKKEAAAAAVTAALEERSAVESHNAAAQARLKEMDHQIYAIRRQMTDSATAHEKEMKTVASKYSGLQDQVKVYHKQLVSVIDQYPVMQQVA